MTASPCMHCVHLYDDSDESVGLYGYGCRMADEGRETIDEVKPCPCFHPYLSSNGLFEYLENEMESQIYAGIA